ncbi:alpha/beta hydrolase [Actinocrinis puniceicyclus]|uniref:Alpha/beta hydrolase n=1 Tax=Actinocrinis puniceicyclus TaxID=977794 RepID=A0A8J7WPS4_9ACTN|nr:alpha/beta hydrolase [Actinocrinis puniceicyclus]MBS2963662.1 alpha/beta hydrolase [Actinocrinis puniceicyclus]
MSTPASTVLPRRARRVELAPAGVFGPVAALDARPDAAPRATALLVPGFTGSKEDFLHVLEPLTEAGVRVVAIDQSGQCDTPGVADARPYSLDGPDGEGYGTSVFGSDIRALVRALAAEAGGPVHLLGHSFGGHAVREALLGARLDAGTDTDTDTDTDTRLPLASVTFLDSGPGAVVAKQSRDQLGLLLSVEGKLTLRQIHEFSPVDEHPDPHVSAFLLRRWLANEPASLFAVARRLLSEPDRTDALKALLDAWQLPCLVMTGADEDVWSAQLLRETADRLGARFALIAGAGHSPNTQQPDLVAHALLEFWLG